MVDVIEVDRPSGYVATMNTHPTTLDLGEELRLHRLQEDPDRWEAAVRQEQQRARGDVHARRTLSAIYCNEDRALDFQRYLSSQEFRALKGMLHILGIHPTQRVCEVGGGPGWLSWALSTSGYTDVTLVEPNGHHNTGTGYLRSRADAGGITIWNDLQDWYDSNERYHVVLTHNCAHHFPGLSPIAAQLRSKLRVGGRWLMVREWFAESAEEVYHQLQCHPYSQRYGLFEFPYPVTYYVDSVCLAGFELKAVIPSYYAGNSLWGHEPAPTQGLRRLAQHAMESIVEPYHSLTPRLFAVEKTLNYVANRAFGRCLRLFSRPQALLFQRRELTRR